MVTWREFIQASVVSVVAVTVIGAPALQPDERHVTVKYIDENLDHTETPSYPPPQTVAYNVAMASGSFSYSSSGFSYQFPPTRIV